MVQELQLIEQFGQENKRKEKLNILSKLGEAVSIVGNLMNLLMSEIFLR
jgi:hypothetical protein